MRGENGIVGRNMLLRPEMLSLKGYLGNDTGGMLHYSPKELLFAKFSSR